MPPASLRSAVRRAPRRGRQSTRNVAPWPSSEFDRDRAALHLDNALRDREAEPGAALLAGVRAVDLLELLEDLAVVRGGDAGAGIAHRQHGIAVLGGRPDRDLACIGELDRVADEVEQHLRRRRASPRPVGRPGATSAFNARPLSRASAFGRR